MADFCRQARHLEFASVPVQLDIEYGIGPLPGMSLEQLGSGLHQEILNPRLQPFKPLFAHADAIAERERQAEREKLLKSTRGAFQKKGATELPKKFSIKDAHENLVKYSLPKKSIA